ncbi:MAG: carboxymuconolactone decarboxylase family protein [Deltaproteobacteria bacterium]|nr:carboxymuconolactone decarboxylase family protein [Deltaproteobacteria bacterium]
MRDEFGNIVEKLGEQWAKYESSSLADGALDATTKNLIALAVAHAVQCPYSIELHTRRAVELSLGLESMTEAVHIGAAIRAGAALVHGVQMLEAYDCARAQTTESHEP